MHSLERVELMNICLIADGAGNVVVQRRQKRSWPGITFPGGHVEPGEPLVDSVVREVYEETGLTVSHLKICGVVDWTDEDGARHMVYLYKANAFTGELRSSDEGEVWWARRDELTSFELSSDVDRMLEIFEGDEFTELHYVVKGGNWMGTLK